MPPDYWDYHLATGCPISRSKEVLSEMTPALRERVFRAIKLQGGPGLLVDPIEQDPLTATKIRQAEAEAVRMADQSGITGKDDVTSFGRHRLKFWPSGTGFNGFSTAYESGCVFRLSYLSGHSPWTSQ